MRLERRFSITEVAEQLGITAKTISRWEKVGRVRRAKRDWRGWRIYTQEDLAELQNLIETVY